MTRVQLTHQADQVEASGNVVRAALCRTRAAVSVTGEEANRERAAALEDLQVLVNRLQREMGLDHAEAAEWTEALLPLLEPAASSYWPVEARLLYDLQKVCVDHERSLYAADLVEWALSWGKKPIIRLLPHHKALMTVKHLRIAVRRLPAIRIADVARHRLSHLVQHALHRAERRLRNELRPEIIRVLDHVELVPENVAEGASRDKLVEELLDRVSERDFLTVGDVRDAIARNRVKLPDVAGPVEFFSGDKLIRANRGLAESLDGIYRRGEIYLRWLQRLSSMTFGTRVGRFLTRFLIIPLLGSFMALVMYQEIEHLYIRWVEPLFGGWGLTSIERTTMAVNSFSSTALAQFQQSLGCGPIPGILGMTQAAVRPPQPHELGVNLYAWLILSVFLFGVLHIGPFRQFVWTTLKWTWRAVRGLLYDLPRAILRAPLVRRFLAGRPVQLLYQLLIKPLPWAALVALLLHLIDAPAEFLLVGAAAAFVLASCVLHSRLGMMLEEVATDSAVRWWHLVHAELLPGIIRGIIYLFRRWMEGLEKLLYTVDEWLRFRSGDSRIWLVIKPVLGVFWYLITYVFRILMNLFVEPTVNPVKHIPTVTATAKLILPFAPQILQALEVPLVPLLGLWAARGVAWAVFIFLPGLGGFLVWELKENWRLYKANQSPTLRPVMVGHHGETVLHLLHPGFHTGTLPKLYAKLRRLKGRSARRQKEALGGVAESLRHFVQRELLAILATSKAWSSAPAISLGDIHPGANRIRIELRAREAPEDSVVIAFEEHSGWLLAGIERRPDGGAGWLDRLSEEQRRAFRDALAGLYKLAGASLVREQIEAVLPPGAAWDVSEDGVVVWPGPGMEHGATYPLTAAKESVPRPAGPPVAIRKLVYERTPVEWMAWAHTWQADHDGARHEPVMPDEVRLLPAESDGAPRLQGG
jgi:hypothetical protein